MMSRSAPDAEIRYSKVIPVSPLPPKKVLSKRAKNVTCNCERLFYFYILRLIL